MHALALMFFQVVLSGLLSEAVLEAEAWGQDHPSLMKPIMVRALQIVGYKLINCASDSGKIGPWQGSNP